MKTKCGLLLATILSTGVIAQPAAPTQPPPSVAPAAPAPTITPSPTNAPAAKPPPKKSSSKKAATAKKTAAIEKSMPPIPPGPAVVGQNNVNVRGQARINSEVVARLSRGDSVTVLEEITLKKPKPDEPAKWARVAFPTNAHVWVHSSFVDAASKTVLPAKLNARSGPGENYSVVGRLQRGEVVKEISVKNEWLEIEPPTNAYAFIAAHLLVAKQPAVASEEPPAAPKPATETAQVETAPAVAPVVEAPATAQPAAPPPAVEAAAAAPSVPEEEEPLPPRIVEREGIVRGTVSIQAPTHYRLVSPDNGRTINYLYSPTTNLVLKPYNGLRIIVTGEEGLDERWTNTPVITLQKIHVVE